MPWPIRMVETVDEIYDAIGKQCVVGWTWATTLQDKNGLRRCVFVMLPGGPTQWWPYDPYQTYPGAPNGWTVTGEWPNATVSPSILRYGNVAGGHGKGYHGYIQNGVLTDTLDGQLYNEWGL